MNRGAALGWIVVGLLLILVAAIPFAAVLLLGVAWGIIASAAVAVLLVVLAERDATGAGLDIIVLGGVAVIIGGICGLAARVVGGLL